MSDEKDSRLGFARYARNLRHTAQLVRAARRHAPRKQETSPNTGQADVEKDADNRVRSQVQQHNPIEVGIAVG